MWLGWGFLILGDPLYFTHSQYSAAAQQMEWRQKGQLPAYHNLPMAILYYTAAGMSNAGVIVFAVFLLGLIYYLCSKEKLRWDISLILLVPMIFNVTTLFLGQSVIFIPHLTPVGSEWRLFNVRYGVMLVPAAAVFFGYFVSRLKWSSVAFVSFLFLIQFGLYGIGYSKVISYADGVEGLSSASRPDAEGWMKDHYDNGLVLMDDYARTMSLIRSGVPMQDLIYIGNKPYWEDSLREPEKYATWIVMQKDDAVWKAIYDVPDQQARLYKYFQKTYTSPKILIFRKPKTAISHVIMSTPRNSLICMRG
jgi:hypothetical protein